MTKIKIILKSVTQIKFSAKRKSAENFILITRNTLKEERETLLSMAIMLKAFWTPSLGTYSTCIGGDMHCVTTQQ